MIDVRNLFSLSIFGIFFLPIFFKLGIRVDIRFSLSIFGISLPIFFKLCIKRSSFKMIFFVLKISCGGVCCIPAALLFVSQNIALHHSNSLTKSTDVL